MSYSPSCSCQQLNKTWRNQHSKSKTVVAKAKDIRAHVKVAGAWRVVIFGDGMDHRLPDVLMVMTRRMWPYENVEALS